jgi:hypothetical protein
VAFGQAVTHDLTKVRIGFSPAAIGARDFQDAPDDPLCQKIAETGDTTIYYLPCTAGTTVNGDGTTTLRLNDDSRYTFVDGTASDARWAPLPLSTEMRASCPLSQAPERTTNERTDCQRAECCFASRSSRHRKSVRRARRSPAAGVSSVVRETLAGGRERERPGFCN